MRKIDLLAVVSDKNLLDLIKNNIPDDKVVFHSIESVENAFKLVNSRYFDLIIVDFSMDGSASFCKSIRNLPGGDYFFIMALVDKSLDGYYSDFIDSRCDDFFETNITPVEIHLRVTVSLFSIGNRIKRRDAEAQLIKAKKHREKVLDSLNLGTVLLDNNGKVLYFNTPMQKLCNYQIEQGEFFVRCIPASAEYVLKLENWLKRPKGKLLINTVNKWFELEHYNDGHNAIVLYAVDMTELMLLKIGRYGQDTILGESNAIRDVLSQITLLAAGDWNVLIEGETGTGKELVARELFMQSKRRSKPFIAVNCAGLTESLATSILFGHKKGAFTGAITDHEGFFEAANGGTLFMDEIGDIPHNIQVLLLRALEQNEITRVGENIPRPVDVRIIAASNKILEDEVSKGNFRDDLYYRLNESKIYMPSLRERKEDIPTLINHFMVQNSLKYPELSNKLSNECLKIMVNYDWPGNIRQLRSAIQFAAIQAEGKVISPRNLPKEILKNSVKYFAKVKNNDQILKAIKDANGNYSKAASLLGISRSTLYRKMKNL